MLAGEAFRDVVRFIRANSVFMPENRMFLLATAQAYGYELTGDGVIIDGDGVALSPQHNDYQSIMMRTKREVMNSSSIGSGLLGD